MALHWTYEEVANPDDPLKQGDILRRSEDIDDLFRQVHPYFCNAKYIAFMVITQSCDLVPRQNEQCKADYINLAVVRDLESCLSRFFESVCETVVPGIFIQQSREEAHRLLERILNQNEQALGLFYLHPDTDTVRISDSATVMLRISVAVRAEHYERLQRARTARLAVEFRNKLGWLVGNLYSRVGTPDWQDKGAGKALAELVRKMVNSEICNWVDRRAVNVAKEAGVQIETLTPEQLVATLEAHKPRSFKERIADEVEEKAEKVVSRCRDVINDRVNDAVKMAHDDLEGAKDKLIETVRQELELAPKKIANRIRNNTVISRAVSREEVA